MIFQSLSHLEIKFPSHIWRCLWKRNGTRLLYGSGYHPRIDEQTKVTLLGKKKVSRFKLNVRLHNLIYN